MARGRFILFLFLFVAGCKDYAVDRSAADFHYERKPLAAELNAFVEWQKADAVFVSLSSEARQAIMHAWSVTGNKLTAAETELFRGFARTNAAALKLLEQSLVKNKAQIPAWDPIDNGPFLRAPYDLVKLRLFLADEAAASGDHTVVTNLLLGNLKFARMLRDADVPLIHYLVMRACRSATEKALFRWAWFSSAKPAVIREVLAQLPELSDEPDAYEHVLRVEFTDFASRPSDVVKMAKDWVDAVRTNETLLSVQPEELQHPLQIIFDPRLVASHPKPLDPAAELEFSNDRFRQLTAAARAPWEVSRLEALSRAGERVLRQYLADLKPLLKVTEGERLPLSEAAVKKARKPYLNIADPIGRYFQANDTLTRTYVYTFQARTERSATRTLLALRIFELEQGRLPRSLEELVQAKLLARLPFDWFGPEPLHYAAGTRSLWSVGEDGVDGGGVPGTSFWQSGDAVWNMPAETR